MKILLDTNVILDIALQREPFVAHAIDVLRIAQHRRFALFVTATTITDLYYIARKAKGRENALGFLRELLQFVEVAGVDRQVIVDALQSDMIDFEDAVQDYAAQRAGITMIITRNQADFTQSACDIHTPESFGRAFRLVA